MKIGIVSLQINSAPYLIEWVAFHRLVGVSRIYLFIDEDSDAQTFCLARRVEAAGYLICHTARRTGDAVEIVNLQTHAADIGLSLARTDGLDWLAHIDDDEFLEPLGARTLAAKLAQVPEDASAVMAQWKMWGPSEPRTGPVIARTRVRPADPQTESYKSIVRVDRCTGLGRSAHRPFGDAGVWYLDGDNPIAQDSDLEQRIRRRHFCLHHFKARTAAEYARAHQSRRWYGSGRNRQWLAEHNPGSHAFWARQTAAAPVRDDWADRWLPALRREITAIRSAIGTAEQPRSEDR